MACLQFFLAEQLVRREWTIPYSFARNYVSDLGATVSPWHALMNGSFVLQGLLIAGGALLTWRRWSMLGRIGMCLLLISGLGVVMVGFVPEDGNGSLHRLGAAFHFLGAGLGMITAGLSARHGAFRWVSIAVGLAVLAATVLVGEGSGALIRDVGVGAVERVAAYGIAGWMVIAGVWLWRQQV